MIIQFIFRLALWLLLTANFGMTNILLGVIVAICIPSIPPSKYRVKTREFLQEVSKVIVAIPKAYFEAIQMMIYPHQQEEVVIQRVDPKRASELVFLDILLITLTPKTIVLNHHENGDYEVHYVRRRRK